MDTIFSDFLKAITNAALVNVLSAGLILVVGLILIKYFSRALEKLLEKRSKLHQSLRKLLLTAVRAALYFLLLISCADKLGIPTTSLITLLGTFGLAFSLALQSTLSDLAGGIFLLISKPFQVGDYIQTAGAEGTVQEIGFIHTRVSTVDNRSIYIPNSAITGSNVTNYTNARRQLDLMIPVAYDCSLEKAKRIIEETVQADPRVLEQPWIRVWELSASSVDIKVRAWCSGSDYWEVRSALLEQIKLRLDESGITIPFQQIDVHLQDNR